MEPYFDNSSDPDLFSVTPITVCGSSSDGKRPFLLKKKNPRNISLVLGLKWQTRIFNEN